MRLLPILFRSSLLFLLFLTVTYLLLSPQPTVGNCPGQHVKYAAFDRDESHLLVVTMPQMPFGWTNYTNSGHHFQVLETGSGRLLASQSFSDTFSQLQFAGTGVSYLLHRNVTAESEAIELHHYQVAGRQDTLVKAFQHVSPARVRPSQWRGSLSADGTLFAYQANVIVPAITVIDGLTGRERCQITWKDDYSALPVFFHPDNRLIAIPLARWDGDYRYGARRQLLLADANTGHVMARYEHETAINNIRFEGERILIYDHDHQVGCVQPGEVAIDWKNHKEPMLPGGHQQLLADAGAAGFFVKHTAKGPVFQLLQQSDSLATWAMEQDYLPIGLRGNMLVSQKYQIRELPSWIQSLNTHFANWFGWYLVSSTKHLLRYQDTFTGTIRCEHQHEIRYPGEGMANRVAGEQHVAIIYAEKDHLAVKVSELFPFWTLRNIMMLAAALTILSSWGKRWLKASRRQTGL